MEDRDFRQTGPDREDGFADAYYRNLEEAYRESLHTGQESMHTGSRDSLHAGQTPSAAGRRENPAAGNLDSFTAGGEEPLLDGQQEPLPAGNAGKAEAAGKQEKQTRAATEVLAWIRDIAIAVILAIIISQFITPTIVQEHSMDDTLHNNDYLILWKGGFKTGHSPEYGDIVVFRSNMDNEDTGKKKLLIKRVVAKGGDTIAISNGVVYRNGEALEEPYTKDGFTNGGMDETVVPDGTLFLLGDNRLVSLDSRSSQVGFVPEDTLVGKAVFRLFPFQDAGRLYGNLNAGE